MAQPKYDPDGHLIWLRHAGGGSATYCEALWVTLVNSNLLVLTGSYYGGIGFGERSLGDAGALFAGYDLEGNLRWLRKTGGYIGRSIAADNAGNAYVTGWFYDSMDFGWTNITAVGIVDFFAAKFDSGGNALWVLHLTNASGSTIALDPGGNVYVTLNTYGPTTLNGVGAI